MVNGAMLDIGPVIETDGLVTKITGDIPKDINISNDDRFLFVGRDQGYLTHGIHKYPAKFFPELPRWLISRYSNEGNLVLDPFAGSGTTNLEALLSNRHSIGVDVDPFARFLAKVKTTPIPTLELRSAWKTLRHRVETFSGSSDIKNIPEFPNRNKWFKPFILEECGYIKSEIDKLDVGRKCKNFFLILFSSILRQVSEAEDNATRLYVRQKFDKNIRPNMAINLFLQRTEKQVEKMNKLSNMELASRVEILEDADARSIPTLKSGIVDLAVTSPPYVNAVDYPRSHQLEIYWLGFETGSLEPLKATHIGTESVKAKTYRTRHYTGNPEADFIINKIFDKDPRRAYIAYKYLMDMSSNLREVYRVLKPGGVYAIVVGNNIIRGLDFENWRYIKYEAEKQGFNVELNFVSAIISHFIKIPRNKKISDDHILILRKRQCQKT